MHNCWKTVNITRELGLGRIYIFSTLCGFLAFILLYLPYSLLHRNINIVDHGFIPVLLIIIALPSLHKLTHAIPLILFNKRLMIRWHFHLLVLPSFTFKPQTTISRKLSIFIWLSPTILISLPGLIAGYILPSYYPYFLLFTAINIGLSFTDLIHVNQLLKAPKKCLIENATEGFDILIKQ